LEKNKFMRRPNALIVLILALGLMLAACGQLTPPEITQAPIAAQPSQAVEQATETTAQLPESTAAIPVAPTNAPTTVANPECRVDASSQVDPALANRFPKVGDSEWSLGPQDAYVTIEEYSDFQ
jgi:hypothetical protein